MKNKASKKVLLKLLKQNKITILLIMILSIFLSTIYALSKPNIYESKSSIDVGKHDIHSSQNIVDSLIYNRNSVSLGTEIELIKSKLLIQNIENDVDITHKYFLKTLMNERELYNSSPFIVDMIYGEGLNFIVRPVNHQYFALEVEGIDSGTLEKWTIRKMYVYGKPAQEKHFLFTLTLKDSIKLDIDTTYRFTVMHKEDAVTAIQNHLDVTKSGDDSSIINIKYQDTIPLRAKEINRALVDEYLAYNIKRKTLESSRILAFIDEQIVGIGSDIKTSEKKINTLKKNENSLSLSYSTQELLKKVHKYEEELSTIDEQLMMLKKFYSGIKKGRGSISLVSEFPSSGLERLFERYQNALEKRKRLRIDYTVAHPAVVSVTKTIKHIKNTIYSTIKTLQFRLEKRKKKLLQLSKEYNKAIKDMPKKEKIYGDIKRKFVVNEKIYGYFLEKRAMTAIAKASAVNQIRLIDKASIPRQPISPNRAFIILMGIIIGIFISLIVILVKEYIDDNITTEADIREYDTLSLIGTIPFIKPNHKGLKVFDSPKSLLAESFRSLRTNLQFIAKEKKGLVVSITSTIGGEGKTTVSSNLAAIMSLRNKKVIILNMDMRKPTLHHKFGLKNSLGMSTLLSLNNTLGEVIQPTPYENIDIIASGPIPPNPSELIENEHFPKVIEALKRQYDVIILDTPPIGLVTDAMYLMKMSDITLYVVRAKYSKKVFLDNILRLKNEHNINDLHLILNGIKNHENGYGYYEE